MTGVVVVSPTELAQLIREQLADALADHDGSPRLLDREGAARFLGISARQLDLLRSGDAPPPEHRVGEAPRFIAAELEAWVRSGSNGLGSRGAPERSGGKDAEGEAPSTAKGSAQKTEGTDSNDSAHLVEADETGAERPRKRAVASDASRPVATYENASTRRQRAGIGNVNNSDNPSSIAGETL